MAKSPLLKLVQRAYRIANISRQTGIPTNEIIEIIDLRISRRELLYGAIALSTTAAITNLQAKRAISDVQERSSILIVGAGIAGLTAAYRLQENGVWVDIIEARNRVGGRLHTLHNAANTGINVELGGEFIDSSHKNVRNLARELNLELVDLYASDTDLTKQVWYFEGKQVSLKEISKGFIPIANKIESDLRLLGDEITYKSHNSYAAKIDKISLEKYVDRIKAPSYIKKLLKVAYTTEYGREPSQQSCLNLLFLIGTHTDDFSIYGESDERYHLRGGNQRIAEELRNRLLYPVETNTILEGINTKSDGRYSVSLRSGMKTFNRTYERILLAIPFTTLRGVKMQVNMNPRKRSAIQQLGYGTNSKLITAYQERIWRTKYKSNGEVYTDLPYQTLWEPTRYAGKKQGLITNYAGGRHGVELGKGTIDFQAEKLVSQINKVFPGIDRLYQTPPIRAYWVGEEYTKGSYSCYLPGQWTKFAGIERQRVGNIFFAGEHCSLEAQGYIEGACETGELAAREILKDLGLLKISQIVTDPDIIQNRERADYEISSILTSDKASLD